MSNTALIVIAILTIGIAVALFAMLQLKKRSRWVRENLIIADIPSPPPGTARMEVHATRRIAGGKPIRVRVESAGSPVEGATVELIRSIGRTVEAVGTTNARGLVAHTAPLVTIPTGFEIRVRKPGHSVYIPPEDERAWGFQTGYYPRTQTTVWPHTPVPGPPPNSPKLWIDVGFGLSGFFDGTSDMSALEAASGVAGWDFDEDWWATKGTLCDHLDELGPGDMWAFSGHARSTPGNPSTATSIAPWRPGVLIRGYGTMTTQELCACFGTNGGPGIGFIDACSSHSLLQDLVDCCMKVAVGWSGPVTGTQSSGAMCDFFTVLMKGGTLQAAIDAANATVSSGFGSSGSTLVVKTKPWLTNISTMTMAQLLEAVEPPPE